LKEVLFPQHLPEVLFAVGAYPLQSATHSL
jgi:hypothetical protein